jgi:hypothetical protein
VSKQQRQIRHRISSGSLGKRGKHSPSFCVELWVKLWIVRTVE